MVNLKKLLHIERKDAGKYCFEDPQTIEARRMLEYFGRRFKLLLVLSVIYGLFFVNFIEIVTLGTLMNAYHLWLFILYFAPFVMMTWVFPRNWPLTLGLGLVASLMNDVFYGLLRGIFGPALPFPLTEYYTLWLVPSDRFLFAANLGFTTVPIYSWMMALSIYGRVAAVVVLFWVWKKQTKKRCLKNEEIEKRLAEMNKPKLAKLWHKLGYGGADNRHPAKAQNRRTIFAIDIANLSVPPLSQETLSKNRYLVKKA